MKWLVETALRLRLVIVVLFSVMLVAGLQVVRNTPLDVFPEFAPPYVEVQTEAPGLSTAEVEALVSVPLENALNGTPEVKKIRSKSVLGLSSVVLYFPQGIDINDARQAVQERLSRVAPTLPSVARPPVMLSPLSSTSRVLKIGVSSDSLSQVEMTTLARWSIRPRLMAVPGVANVAIWGQRDRQLQVLVNPEQLRNLGLTLAEVEQAAADATTLAGGGFVDTPNQRLALSQSAAIQSAADLAQVPVTFRNGVSLKLGEVAQVVEGFPAPIGDAVINDGPGLLLIVEKQPGANTLDVTRQVEAALDAMRPGLKGLEIDSTIFRPATFIEMSLDNLNKSLLIGCVLVVVVLLFFLYEWRTALISALALPTSLIAAALVLRYSGRTIDTMVLAGLIISLGEVVDDAIIDVENIMRRLRLNREAGSPQTPFAVVFEASMEVRSAVIYGSLIVALVLLPIFLLPGLSGAFFQPLAFSYVLAILASLFVALTLTPALALLLLPKAAEKQAKEAPVVAWLKRHYGRLLPALLARPKRVAWTLAGVAVASMLTLPFFGQEFLPNFKEYDFLMHWVEKPGTSLPAMSRITVRASKELRAIPGVRNFGAHIGRAEVADEVVGPNFTELWISVDPSVDYEATVAKIQEVVDGYPGLYRDLLTYLRERIKEVLTGTSATVVVRIFGPDLDQLYTKAKEVGSRLEGVDGVVDLKVQQQTLVPQIQVKLRPESAARYGLSPGDLLRAIGTLVRGRKVGEIYQEQKIFDVAVWGQPAVRADFGAVRDLLIAVPSGGSVPLSEVADVRIVPTPNEITREASSRRIDVTLNVRGRDLGSVARDVQAQVDQVQFGAGYHPEILGEYAERQASQNRMLMLVGLSLIGIFLVLYTDFGTVRLAVLGILSLFFAVSGCLLAAFLTGGVLSLGSIVGFITVLGVAARNSIMLVSHYQHLEREEGMSFGKELVIRGSLERVSPIIMTALTSVLALLPIIVSGNVPGAEIEHPMSVVILGGVVTSTVLNLLGMPALYWAFGRPKAPEPAAATPTS
ncbi:efflux RND transporter permease subunit [Hymenobacter sp. 15J16-1T3B]|uniref:efflux RND transporter permease subunit n=1 Tax=Hymenobacter sp. 15J16-1T3B TaxID=2886941 RepID=UPI001D110CEE|nr:efflux RND transporter permease subunit [Hymenobacter sp. 15J16-1T3B]MCC3160161.1 efflux RND transporter permease subunit [Hymenobacter sp. 15J16-1T3B]